MRIDYREKIVLCEEIEMNLSLRLRIYRRALVIIAIIIISYLN
jgi:hypothetical protein